MKVDRLMQVTVSLFRPPELKNDQFDGNTFELLSAGFLTYCDWKLQNENF